ncbi:MAG: L,D-transpeptidase, partial [Clostridia bacterium]|nr:L,D-transpeptidase [Clostridia bacterium]
MLKKLISCFLIMGLLFCFSGAALAQYKIVVSTSANKLYLYQDGSLTNTYSVATGKSASPTPTGTFHIIV